MTTIAPETETPAASAAPLVGEAPPSPAGPVDAAALAALAKPPNIPLSPLVQSLRFSQRQIEFVFGARRRYGEVFRMRGIVSGGPIITSHPDHVRSLFTAKPEQAPSLTKESPLRPIVGPNSVLTALAPATCASASCCCRPSTARRSRPTRGRSPRRPNARSTAGRSASRSNWRRGCRRSPST